MERVRKEDIILNDRAAIDILMEAIHFQMMPDKQSTLHSHRSQPRKHVPKLQVGTHMHAHTHTHTNKHTTHTNTTHTLHMHTHTTHTNTLPTHTTTLYIKTHGRIVRCAAQEAITSKAQTNSGFWYSKEC